MVLDTGGPWGLLQRAGELVAAVGELEQPVPDRRNIEAAGKRAQYQRLLPKDCDPFHFPIAAMATLPGQQRSPPNTVAMRVQTRQYVTVQDPEFSLRASRRRQPGIASPGLHESACRDHQYDHDEGQGDGLVAE